MDPLFSGLLGIGFLDGIWIFFVLFAVHEFEEWNIADFERTHFIGVPETVSHHSTRWWIAFIIGVGFLICLLATLPGDPAFAAWVALPAVLISIANALQHAYWTIRFRHYAPGLLTALLLIVPAGGILTAWALWENHIPVWYILLLLAAASMMVTQTVKAGSTMTPFIRGIHRIGHWLENLAGQ